MEQPDFAVGSIEHACMILSKLESKKSGKNEDETKVTLKLDKSYLQLVELYLDLDQVQQSKNIINTIESRLESVCKSQAYAYRIMNDLANVLKKYNNHELSICYYKKALLCMKKRYKNKYI